MNPDAGHSPEHSELGEVERRVRTRHVRVGHHKPPPSYLAVGVIVAACLARAAAAQALPASLQACAQEKVDSRRLSCYDREMGRYAIAFEQTFGLSQQQVRKAQHLEQKDSDKPASLTANPLFSPPA